MKPNFTYSLFIYLICGIILVRLFMTKTAKPSYGRNCFFVLLVHCPHLSCLQSSAKRGFHNSGYKWLTENIKPCSTQYITKEVLHFAVSYYIFTLWGIKAVINMSCKCWQANRRVSKGKGEGGIRRQTYSYVLA